MSFEYTDITRNNQLTDLMQDLNERQVRVLAMDFEGEFNLHVYGERLCLIQVYDGDRYFLVDPMSISRDIIGRFLTMKNMLYMFYSADSDRSLVYKTLGVKMLRVYDVQHLVEVLDLPKKGLDGVLESELGVTVTGKKRYQRQNWMNRPIEEGAKQYALGDVAHLFRLHQGLLEKIEAEGLTEALVFRLAGSEKDWDKKTVPGVFKMPAYRKLSRAHKDRFQAIFDFREAAAKELDVPAHFVIPKQELIPLAEDPLLINRLRFGGKVSAKVQERLIREISDLSGL